MDEAATGRPLLIALIRAKGDVSFSILGYMNKSIIENILSKSDLNPVKIILSSNPFLFIIFLISLIYKLVSKIGFPISNKIAKGFFYYNL